MRRLISTLFALAFVLPSFAANVVVIRLDDTIHPASQAFFERAIAYAEEVDAELLLVELDTPGGRVDTTRQMTEAMAKADVPIALWVTPSGSHAASAGFILLLGADFTAMSTGTNTGAAHPVMSSPISFRDIAPPGSGSGSDDDGEESSGNSMMDTMMGKVTNDVAAMVRSLAERKGIDPDLAEEAVRQSRAFSSQEAHELGLIDMVTDDRSELLAAIDGQTFERASGRSFTPDLEAVEILVVEKTTREKLMNKLAIPELSFIFLIIAVSGILAEIKAPGALVPGIIGFIALLMFLYSSSILPVNWFAVILIVLAVVLFVLEAKVVSYGLLSLGGIISFVIGALLLFDSEIPAMRLGLDFVLPIAVILAGTLVFLISRIVATHRAKTLTGQQGIIGEIGEALSELAPKGKVLVHGEWWTAIAEGASIDKGCEVEVVSIDGLTIRVRPSGTAG